MRVAGLFAGIGGLEVGFHRSGISTEFLCEYWDPAREVLADRFDIDENEIAGDVAKVRSIPAGIDILTAGFPCTDLSQAGRMAGIDGEASGLVSHVFRLLRGARRRKDLPTWLVIENVPNMLQLDKGQAMRFLVSELERLGMRWAYRVVDSRFTGVPQRRRRVILVASKTEDPRNVVFAEDAGERPDADYRDDAFGFYWTEGRLGLGWAVDAVPTLKGGSTIGIPSPPAIWVPGEDIGRQLVTPGPEDAEALQGFDRGWTAAADTGSRNGPRQKMVGNAVTVGVAEWLGSQLIKPGDWTGDSEEWNGPRSWPTAAWGEKGKVYKLPEISEFPRHLPYQHLLDVVDPTTCRAVTHRAAKGFNSRLERGNLGRHPGFREAVAEHVEASDPDVGIISHAS